MKKLLPILLIIIGIGAGGAAGFVLRSEPEPEGDAMVEGEEVVEEIIEEPPLDLDNVEFVKLNNQFVVPVVEGDRVESLVVLSISLETAPEHTEMIYAREPKIRDEFLRVLFDHSYTGGFSGAFTASPTLDSLVSQLLIVANKIAKNSVSDVLITDILRQDN